MVRDKYNGFKIGGRCKVFDCNKWLKTGDIGNNECFWANATITAFRKNEENEILVDVILECGRESNGHYLRGIRMV